MAAAVEVGGGLFSTKLRSVIIKAVGAEEDEEGNVKRKGERDGATRSLDWDDLQQKKKQIYSNKIMIKNK